MNRQFAGASEIVEFESAQSAMQSELSGGPGKKKKNGFVKIGLDRPPPAQPCYLAFSNVYK